MYSAVGKHAIGFTERATGIECYSRRSPAVVLLRGAPSPSSAPPRSPRLLRRSPPAAICISIKSIKFHRSTVNSGAFPANAFLRNSFRLDLRRTETATLSRSLTQRETQRLRSIYYLPLLRFEGDLPLPFPSSLRGLYRLAGLPRPSLWPARTYRSAVVCLNPDRAANPDPASHSAELYVTWFSRESVRPDGTLIPDLIASESFHRWSAKALLKPTSNRICSNP